MTPNINVNLGASVFILIASVALSYFTHIGWWAFGGLAYLIYAKVQYEVLEWIFLGISILLFTVAIANMGWSF